MAEDWEYRRFWTNVKWACATTAPSFEDVAVFLFDMAQHGLFRTDRSGRQMRPFVERSMRSFKAHSAPPRLFPHGLFFVLQSAAMDPSHRNHAAAMSGMKLFAVCPRRLRSHLVADHFTFDVNRGLEASQRLQFHFTKYLVDGSAQFVSHRLNPLPLDFSMHHDFGDFRREHLGRTMADRPIADKAHFIMTRGACVVSRPWRPYQAGGKPADDATPATLDELWRTKPIRRLMLICVRNTDGGVDVSVRVQSRRKPIAPNPAVAEPSAVFKCEASKAVVVARAVQILSTWSDGEFAM